MDTIYNTNGCFYRALDDEPVFVLLARDPCFAEAVRWWVTLRQALIGRGEKPLEDHSVLAEAMSTAAAGVAWRSEATGPAWLEGPRWHTETAPKRELVPADRMATLETRLLKDANQFLQYAQSHFDKGTAESDAKGEVNWQHYLDICADLGINPTEKPVASKDPKHARDRLNYEDWLVWKQKAMPIGNDFLLGLHKGRLWFSQRQHLKSGTREWSDLYMLQSSLQCDMIRGMYNDYRTRQTDRADRLKSLLPDYKGTMAKIALGLRQVVGEYLAVVRGTTWPDKRKNQMNEFADRIAGYAAELEEPAVQMLQEAMETPPEFEDRPLDPSLYAKDGERHVGKHPSLAAPYTPTSRFHDGGIIPAGTEAPRLFRPGETEVKRVAVDAPTPEEVLESFRKRFPEPYAAFMSMHSAKAPSDMIDVTDTPDMPPHRFTMFTKARGWAYGRGLEINPSHIPDMLDRMDADGWHLQAVFGGVEPTKVGMLFRRMDVVRGEEEVYVRELPPSVAEMMAAPTEGVDIGYGRGQQP